jgi:hypothetical protein
MPYYKILFNEMRDYMHMTKFSAGPEISALVQNYTRE